MTQRWLFFLVVFGVWAGFLQSVHAKDLTTRLGVGYKDQFSVALPSIAVQYYPNANLGVAAALGLDTQSQNSKFGFSVKVFRVIYMEDNLNFYMGTSAGLVSVESGSSTSSGFELNGLIGCEYFFGGLENLGFTFETGVAVRSISSGVSFRTVGDSPLRGGVTFYF
jgi:hypothetical protein